MRGSDGDRSWLLVVWCGASWEALWTIVELWIVVVMLAGVSRCRWMVGRADSDSRIQNEVEDEEACSEFWSSYLRVEQ